MPRPVTVRLGLPKSTGALPGAAEALDTPVLLSAMSLWSHATGRFRAPGSAICDLDVALDSAGFVAMSRFGAYPWTPAQYVELAGRHSWAWWASMDYCCEPEVAADRSEREARVVRTSRTLADLLAIVRQWRAQGCTWLTDPMPVLQGWTPEDYALSVAMTSAVLGNDWPPMVGVGSVCRRPLDGPNGVWAILQALDRLLPAHVGVHLFGVKGGALHQLATHPRVESTDSQAWGIAARREAHARGVPCTIPMKVAAMGSWLDRQRTPPPTTQCRLF